MPLKNKEPMIYNPVKEHECFERFDFYNYDVQCKFPDISALNWPWYYQSQSAQAMGVETNIYEDVTCMIIELAY